MSSDATEVWAERFVVDNKDGRLGAGRFATVYRAFDLIQRRTVALKVLKARSLAAAKRMRDEFRHISKRRTRLHAASQLVSYHRLISPPAPGTSSTAQHSNRCLLSMQLIEGTPLNRWLYDVPPGPARAAQIESILWDIVQGLHVLHSSGLIHHDLTPGNILVNATGPTPRAVLVDYGLTLPATAVRRHHERNAQHAAGLDSETQKQFAAEEDLHRLGATLFNVIVQEPAINVQAQLEASTLSVPWKQLIAGLLGTSAARHVSLSWLIEHCRTLCGREPISLSSERQPSANIRQTAEQHQLVKALRGISFKRDLVLLTGPPSSGKTVLIDQAIHELERSCDAHAPLVLRAGCEGGLFTNHGAAQAVADTLSEKLRDELSAEVKPLAGIHALARSLGGLSMVHGLFAGVSPPHTEAMADDTVAEMARAAWRGLFERLQLHRRVIVVIDDAHRGDEDSARLFSALLEPRLPNLTLVMVGRQTPSGGALYALADKVAHPHRIELTCPSEDTSTLQSDDDPLSDIQRRVLSAAACAYTPLTARELMAVAGLSSSPPDEVIPHIYTLEDIGILDTTGAHERLLLPPGPLREGLQATTGASERVSRHSAIASCLLDRSAVERAPLFRHLLDARRFDEARDWGQQAAVEARKALAFRAEADIRRVLMHATGAMRDLASTKALAEALVRAGCTAESAHWFEVAADLARRDEQPLKERDALLRLAGRQRMFSGDFAAGKELFLRAARELDVQPPASSRRALAEALFRRLTLVARESREGVLPTDRRSAPDPMKVQALWDASMATAMVDYPTSDAWAMRHLAAVRGTALRSHWLRALSREAASCATLAGLLKAMDARATRMVQACTELERDSDDPLDSAWLWFAKRSVAWFRADWKAAVTAAEQAEQLLSRCHSVAWDRAVNDVFLTSALAMTGDVQTLQERLEVGWREAELRADRYSATSLRLGEPLVGFASDDCAGMLERARQVLEGWPLAQSPGLVFPWIQTLVGCGLYQGDGSSTLSALERPWAIAQSSGSLQLQCVGDILQHARARVLLACGERRGARRIAHRLRRSNLAMARGFGAALQAGAAFCDRPERAQELLAEAVQCFADNGMSLYEAACRFRLTQLQGAPDSSGLESFGLPSPERAAAAMVPVHTGR